MGMHNERVATEPNSLGVVTFSWSDPHPARPAVPMQRATCSQAFRCGRRRSGRVLRRWKASTHARSSSPGQRRQEGLASRACRAARGSVLSRTGALAGTTEGAVPAARAASAVAYARLVQAPEHVRRGGRQEDARQSAQRRIGRGSTSVPPRPAAMSSGVCSGAVTPTGGADRSSRPAGRNRQFVATRAASQTRSVGAEIEDLITSDHFVCSA